MNLNNTNLAKGGGANQYTKKLNNIKKANDKWEISKKENKVNNNNNTQRFSNYSGHHMKGSYQKANSTWEQTNKQSKQHQQNNDFQTSLPMASPQPD